jgi:heterodisulfide reductase subunit C
MINLETCDPRFKNQVAAKPGGEKALNCFLCGTCTAGCPVGSLRKEYNPRRMMRMILLGMKEQLLSSPEIWQCRQCHICVAHCPQDVRFADVIRVIRQLAIEAGKFSPELPARIEKMDQELIQQRITQVDKMIGDHEKR